MKTTSEINKEFGKELKSYLVKNLGILALAIVAAHGVVALTGAGVLWVPTAVVVDLPSQYILTKNYLRRARLLTTSQFKK